MWADRFYGYRSRHRYRRPRAWSGGDTNLPFIRQNLRHRLIATTGIHLHVEHDRRHALAVGEQRAPQPGQSLSRWSSILIPSVAVKHSTSIFVSNFPAPPASAAAAPARARSSPSSMREKTRMTRISLDAVARAMRAVEAMNLQQKEALTDEIFLAQPHMLGSVFVLPKLGVLMEKTGFAIELLLLCFQAMKESAWTWPLITEDDQELQQRIHVTTIRPGEDLSPPQQDRLMQQYLRNHPEQNLLACIGARTADWLERIDPEDSDRYVMLAATNLLNCIAFVPLPESRPAGHGASNEKRPMRTVCAAYCFV
ncbi:hypothetical protein [Paraburkholderia sp. BL23I1N1]|uniref:hypothetical protein n=1 Tax=Paraburkholderia sp. BL23I1N1 TaxID=1938802 RepID=UPI0015FFEC2F|nr:hypothetical protein [Paraburkholderia sp. BL23I1N1]